MVRIVLLFLVFAFNVSFSQNLIKNGGFEIYSECPMGVGSYKINLATGWANLMGETSPDLFNKCTDSTITPRNKRLFGKINGVPKNFNGFQNPKTGNGYAGLVLFSAKDYSYQERIFTKLIQPLKKDSSYEVSFYISLCDISCSAAKKIAFSFAKEVENYGVTIPHLDKKIYSVIIEKENGLYNDSVNWELVHKIYKAKGGEKYLILASFPGLYSRSEHCMLKKIAKKYTELDAKYIYYYIDDVVVVPFKSGNDSFAKP